MEAALVKGLAAWAVLCPETAGTEVELFGRFLTAIGCGLRSRCQPAPHEWADGFYDVRFDEVLRRVPDGYNRNIWCGAQPVGRSTRGLGRELPVNVSPQEVEVDASIGDDLGG